MARRTRDFKPGVAMHVWQRANHQEAILLDDLDFVSFLRLLQGHCEDNRVRVCGYCVMTNHYHVVTVADARESLSRAIGRVNQDYSALRHRTIGKVGQLWQGRFGSCVLDEAHFWATLCYVERNPVEAGMVLAASDWRWSSARAHLGMADGDWLDMTRWQERYDGASWARALEVGIRDSALEERIAAGKIWHQTKLAARPCGKAVEMSVAEGGGWVDTACA
jgi:putative transposase